MNLNIQNINVKSENFIIVGDFNSHSQSWGYNHIYNRGEEIEDWQDENNLTLINRPNDAPTFYSRVWHTTSTPDIALCTEDVHRIIEREVGNQLGVSDHRPVYLTIAVKTVSVPVLPRWNYKKANWLLYHHRTSVLTKNIHIYYRDINKVVSEFTRCILQAAKEAIPKGDRKEYNHTGIMIWINCIMN